MPLLYNTLTQYLSPSKRDRVEVKTSSGTVTLQKTWLNSVTTALEGVDCDGKPVSIAREHIVNVSVISIFDPSQIVVTTYSDGSTTTNVLTGGTVQVDSFNFSGPPIDPFTMLYGYPLPSGRSKLLLINKPDT